MSAGCGVLGHFGQGLALQYVWRQSRCRPRVPGLLCMRVPGRMTGVPEFIGWGRSQCFPCRGYPCKTAGGESGMGHGSQDVPQRGHTHRTVGGEVCAGWGFHGMHYAGAAFSL